MLVIPQAELAMRGSYGVDLVPGISPSLWSRSAAELPAKIPPGATAITSPPIFAAIYGTW